ncbi:MAG: restriction endonuclease subunit S [Anaerolineales bacterium]|nr:restriction endonuclease subunit S [Anaerolineales bacterium]
MTREIRFKQTECGQIPREWDTVSIGEFITEYRGGASLKPSDFTNSGFKVLPKGGVGRSSWLKVKEEDQKFCSQEYAAINYRNQVDETFTIVVLRDLVPSGPSIGLMVQIRDCETYILAQGVYGFKVNEKIIPGYLVQLSNTRWYRRLANSIMVGSTQVHITNTAFKRIEIPLPSLPEQRAIAEALSDADALIEALEQLIAKKRLVKQGAMQELLTGKRRLPGFSGEWDRKKLGEICEIVMGQSPRSSQYNMKGLGLPLIQGNADVINRITVKRVFTTEITKRGRAGDILMSVRAPVGEVSRATFDLCLGRGVCAIRYPNEFLYHALIFKEPAWVKMSKGSTFDAVNSADIKAFEIDIPINENEQIAISELLSDMDAELTVLEEKLAKARQVKQGMMQELLTGRIRLV